MKKTIIVSQAGLDHQEFWFVTFEPYTNFRWKYRRRNSRQETQEKSTAGINKKLFKKSQKKIQE